MLLFTNCYTDDGYLSCCMRLPDENLEEVDKQRMLQMVPAEIVWLMTACDVPLYSGVLQGRRVLHIRNIPTRFQDENRRSCFIHLTFVDIEAEVQQQLTAYLLHDYPDFVQRVNHMICYAGKRYEVIRAALEQLLKEAQRHPGCALREGRALVVPGETPVEYFCSHNVLGIHSSMDADWERLPAVDVSQLPMPQRKGRNRMTLYFYCNSPQEGFHFLEVDPQTGETLANELKGKIDIDPLIYRMIVSNGANMALCHKQNAHTFFVRYICSPGNNERFGFVMQNAEERLARQFAAWAVFDYSSFCAAVLACVEIDGGICVMKPEQVQRLMQNDWAANPCVQQTAVWKTLTTPQSNRGKPYSLLVVDYDLRDFNSSLNMSVDKTMAACLMNTSQLSDLRGMISAQSAASCGKAAEAPSQLNERKNAPCQPVTSDPPEQNRTAMAAEDESADLLHTKWFIPGAIGVGVLILLCILFAVFRGRAGVRQPDPTEAGATVEATMKAGNE